MSQKSMSLKDGTEIVVRDIRRKTRKQDSIEEKIRIVLLDLRGEDSIVAAKSLWPAVLHLHPQQSARLYRHPNGHFFGSLVKFIAKAMAII